ncbi:hypothetical protein LJC00_04175 [Dysgonomonas sp. OttesenSCG-928-M03]|nr:hypothetical protein [Dysgonomonas sp. OttesenSCG-928-M03]
MRNLLIVLALFVSVSTLTAQDVIKKWNDIYKRYEYYDSRSNMIGYEKWNSIYNRWEYTDTQKNNQSNNNRNQYIQPYDIDLIERALILKQQQYEKQLELHRQNEAKKTRINRERVAIMVQQINTYYKSAKSYPQTIRNGWHNVYVSNGYDVCGLRKVYVENNKITQYVIDEWYYKDISSTMPIKNGAASVTLNQGKDMFTVVFLEYIYEPNKTTEAPKELGTISFWHNKKGGSDTDVWVDGIYVGTITSYFKEGEPNCGQTGTLSFRYKPGTYKYEAQNNRSTWNGTVTITSGQCSKMRLNK